MYGLVIGVNTGFNCDKASEVIILPTHRIAS